MAGPGNASSLLAAHIETVCGHYAGRLQAWDVVNEVVDPPAPGGLRDTPWLRFLGPGYIAAAFHAARAADPAAVLFLNDYGLEPDSPSTDAKRLAMLALLRRLLDADAPVQGLGLQAHLVAGNRFDSLAGFLGQVGALGLRVAVSELDVSDERLPANPCRGAMRRSLRRAQSSSTRCSRCARQVTHPKLSACNFEQMAT